MKKVLFIVFSLVAISCAGEKEKTVAITFEIKKPINGGWVKLEKVSSDGIVTQDSFKIADSKPITRNLKVDAPTLYRVNLFDRQMGNLVLNETDTNVKIEAEGDNPRGIFKVTGSQDTDYLVFLQQLQGTFQSQVQQLDSQFKEAVANGDQGRAMELQQAYLALQANHEQNLKNKVWAMGHSITAVLATDFFTDMDRYFTFLDSIANRFNAHIPNSPYTKALVSKVDAVRNTSIGALAPEINLPTPEGDYLALSSLRGKYVLIDFWAAWCRPCRIENPTVVKAYQKYAPKGFEVYGVSLDRTREDWVKAIAADGLPWKHVSDLKFWQSEGAQTYKVKAIPATFLLDPDGKIIGKNLRGEALLAKLEEIFN